MRSTRSASSRWCSRDAALADVDPPAASLVLGEALALWRGRAFEDFTYEAFAHAEIARLEELRLEAVELRVDADLAAGSRSRAGLGVGVARTSASTQRTTVGKADARPVSIVAAGRRAAGVSAAEVAPGRGARHRAVVVDSPARVEDRHRRRVPRGPSPAVRTGVRCRSWPGSSRIRAARAARWRRRRDGLSGLPARCRS